MMFFFFIEEKRLPKAILQTVNTFNLSTVWEGWKSFFLNRLFIFVYISKSLCKKNWKNYISYCTAIRNSVIFNVDSCRNFWRENIFEKINTKTKHCDWLYAFLDVLWRRKSDFSPNAWNAGRYSYTISHAWTDCHGSHLADIRGGSCC